MRRVRHDLRTTHVDPLYGVLATESERLDAEWTTFNEKRSAAGLPQWKPAVTAVTADTAIRKPRKKRDSA